MSKIKPNLPENKIKNALVSTIMPNEMLKELEIQGVFGLKIDPTPNIANELKYHPDILVLNTPDNRWYSERSYKCTINTENTEIKLSGEYPYDCIFNAMFVNEKLICGKRTDVSYLKDKYEIIRVNQGYVKCSTIFVDAMAYITSDAGIAKVLKETGCDVFIADNQGIGLNGFSCGFIGGCAGKISKNEIVFTGDINKYKYASEIKSFCANYGVNCISLSDKPLYDYGGVLPIIC